MCYNLKSVGALTDSSIANLPLESSPTFAREIVVDDDAVSVEARAG